MVIPKLSQDSTTELSAILPPGCIIYLTPYSFATSILSQGGKNPSDAKQTPSLFFIK